MNWLQKISEFTPEYKSQIVEALVNIYRLWSSVESGSFESRSEEAQRYIVLLFSDDVMKQTVEGLDSWIYNIAESLIYGTFANALIYEETGKNFDIRQYFSQEIGQIMAQIGSSINNTIDYQQRMLGLGNNN